MPNIFTDTSMSDAPPVGGGGGAKYVVDRGSSTPPSAPQLSTLTLPVAHIQPANNNSNNNPNRASSEGLDDDYLDAPEQHVRSSSAPAARDQQQQQHMMMNDSSSSSKSTSNSNSRGSISGGGVSSRRVADTSGVGVGVGMGGGGYDGVSDEYENGAPDVPAHVNTTYDRIAAEDIKARRSKNNSLAAARALKMAAVLPLASLRTGLCYDVRMRYHATVDKDELHPEDPRRIHVIYKAIADAGLVEDKEALGVRDEADVMLRILAREVKYDEAMLVHSDDHWKFIESTKTMSNEDLNKNTETGDSVFFNNESFFCSKLSCGGAIETARAVWTGQVKNAIAVIRPPGHHAEPHKCMGFCLLNNVAVATRTIQRDYPECKKVLILDWDVHHGNGTQTAFYDDPTVLYMSIHRYGNGEFYPPSLKGNYDYVGVDDAAGMNVNVPWETGGMCDADYLYAFQRCLMPIAYEFNPDLVIISAGFDAAAGDSIGGCYVTPNGYAHMTHMLMSLAGGKVVVCLEGGYNLMSISQSALAVTKTLMGEPPGPIHTVYASNKAISVVQDVIAEHSQYWRCLEYKALKDTVKAEGVPQERLHDVIRMHQSNGLKNEHNMMPLVILRNHTSPSFQDQLMATVGFDKQKVLLFIIHDAPQVVATPQHATNTIKLHNSYLVDSSKKYLEWGIKKGYGVIDLNVPAYITPQDDKTANHSPPNSSKMVEQLSLYIWDNYIDLSQAEKVLLMGVGEAYCGVVHILSMRDATSKVVAAVSFLADHNLRAVNPTRDESIGSWYHRNSRVFVSSNHSVWSNVKRAKHKFGSLVKVDSGNITNIQAESFDDATGFMEGQIDVSGMGGGQMQF